MVVFRPADANEVVEAWRVAIERTDGPTTLIFSRQALPIFDRTSLGAASGARRGGYVLADYLEGRPTDPDRERFRSRPGRWRRATC